MKLSFSLTSFTLRLYLFSITSSFLRQASMSFLRCCVAMSLSILTFFYSAFLTFFSTSISDRMFCFSTRSSSMSDLMLQISSIFRPSYFLSLVFSSSCTLRIYWKLTAFCTGARQICSGVFIRSILSLSISLISQPLVRSCSRSNSIFSQVSSLTLSSSSFISSWTLILLIILCMSMIMSSFLMSSYSRSLTRSSSLTTCNSNCLLYFAADTYSLLRDLSSSALILSDLCFYIYYERWLILWLASLRYFKASAVLFYRLLVRFFTFYSLTSLYFLYSSLSSVYRRSSLSQLPFRLSYSMFLALRAPSSLLHLLINQSQLLELVSLDLSNQIRMRLNTLYFYSFWCLSSTLAIFYFYSCFRMLDSSSCLTFSEAQNYFFEFSALRYLYLLSSFYYWYFSSQPLSLLISFSQYSGLWLSILIYIFLFCLVTSSNCCLKVSQLFLSSSYLSLNSEKSVEFSSLLTCDLYESCLRTWKLGSGLPMLPESASLLLDWMFCDLYMLLSSFCLSDGAPCACSCPCDQFLLLLTSYCDFFISAALRTLPMGTSVAP